MTWLFLGTVATFRLGLIAVVSDEAIWMKALDWGLGFGLAALFLRLFVTGVIRRGSDVDAANARADASEARYARLMEVYMGELSPAMLRLHMETERFSQSASHNAELMERLITTVLSVTERLTRGGDR